MAIVSRDSAGTNNNLSVLTDHLGSVVGMLEESGDPAISESFAAYGERRDPTDWQGPIANESAIAALTQRGFTGQTHLDASRLIHFGGRVLDAQFGRFLSADPNVPDPGSTQSFNRYSYTQNNPLSRLDPGGFVDISLGGFAENFNVSVSWRFGRRYTYRAPQTGCMVANAIGCYGPAPVKALLEVIVDKVIGPLPSYGWDDSLILYFTQPDCPILSNCGNEDGYADNEGGWGWEDAVARTIDFIFGRAEAQTAKPTLVNPSGKGIRGCDSQGCGSFTSPRVRNGQPGVHRAADYITTPGQDIVAISDGTVARLPSGKYDGIVVGDGQGTSWTILYADIDPAIKVGDKISAGQILGTAQDITSKYPGITNHVHVKLRINYKVVDPANHIPPP